MAAQADPAVIRWTALRCRGMSNTKDKLGRTPLLLALLAGAAPPAVTELLNTGEDPSLEDDVGRTCTEAAVLYCSAAVVEIVIKAMIALRNSLVDSDGIVEIDKVILSNCNERMLRLTLRFVCL